MSTQSLCDQLVVLDLLSATMQQLPHPVYMQQLAHPAYMQQQQQQQWPLPPLWHTNNNNGNWFHNANMAAASAAQLPRWQLEANVWNMMHQLQPQSTSIAMQPQAPRPSQLQYNHAAATAAAHGNSSHDLMTSSSAPVAAADRVVLQPSQPCDAPTRVANEPLISKEKPQDLKPVNQLAKLIAAARDQTNASPSTAAVAESASNSKFKPPRTTARPVIPQPEPEQQQQQPQQQLAPGPQSRSNPPIKLAAKVASSAAAAVALEPLNQLAVDTALAVPVTLASSKQTSAASTTTGPAPRGQGNTCVTRGEQCALEALESLFPGKTFAKVRPDWLINDCTGRAMEIDLYCHELRVGVEHSGKSHYVFPNSLHKTRDEYELQRRRDALKRVLCAREGVLLVEIPFTVPHASMKAYIQSEIERLSDEHEQ